MVLRQAEYKDIDDIMNIVFQAQDQFKKDKIDQWQNNYPNYTTIEEDIKNKDSYVLVKNNLIVGTVYFSFDGESTYEKIYQGEWLSHGKYAVIHRLAVDLRWRGKGLAEEILRELERIAIEKDVFSIKVDTHRENLPMQKLLGKMGYKYCGIIYLKDKNERLAYERKLD